MITFKHKGNFNKTEKFLSSAQRINIRRVLEKYAIEGVSALSTSTPRDTGTTASSWDYIITIKRHGQYSVSWTNSNIKNGVSIAMIIQYGHGTRDGSFIQGVDYINPAMKPVFDKIAENVWKEITSL